MTTVLAQQETLPLSPPTDRRRRPSRRLHLSGRLQFSSVLLGCILVFAIVGPIVVSTADPLKIVGGLYDHPSALHLLGTDNFGRDVLIQLMYGTRSSLMVGVIAGTIAVLVGVAIGSIAGFRAGYTEEALMGATNVVISIPSIVVLILLSIAVGSRSLWTMGIIIGITSWPWTARAVRAQTSSLRTRPHVDVARISGAGTLQLIAWEVLPYMLSYLCLAFVLQLAAGILQEAALSLLGLGPSQGVSLGTRGCDAHEHHPQRITASPERRGGVRSRARRSAGVCR